RSVASLTRKAARSLFGDCQRARSARRERLRFELRPHAVIASPGVSGIELADGGDAALVAQHLYLRLFRLGYQRRHALRLGKARPPRLLSARRGGAGLSWDDALPDAQGVDGREAQAQGGGGGALLLFGPGAGRLCSTAGRHRGAFL